MNQLTLPTMPAPLRLKIVHDTDPESPREWCNLGTMVCWHNRYTLGDEQPRGTALDYLLNLASVHMPNIDEDCDKLARLRVAKILEKHYIMRELYLYDHSGITMRTSAFGCPWDSGQVGFIYISREKALKEFGWKVLTAKRRAQLESYLDNEVQTYDDYLTGNVYGYVVEEQDNTTGEWEETDSCWGFYGEDIEGVHGHATPFTLEQVREAFADPWFNGHDGCWVTTNQLA